MRRNRYRQDRLNTTLQDFLRIFSPYTVEKVLQKDEGLDDQCQELSAKANENGGNDNITVLLADFSSKDGDMP